MTFRLVGGDAIQAMQAMAENSVDAIVTDPPYNLAFMGQVWDRNLNHGLWATEALRILKPGGHLLAFGGTRTYHRLACAIEDAGFEIRDCLAWMYGSGFPKSLDVSKAIDKAAGAEREVVGMRRAKGIAPGSGNYGGGTSVAAPPSPITTPATPEAQRWAGYGTSLKPAFEPIVLARKPLAERNVAANVQRWGTGALNIDGCRIGQPEDKRAAGSRSYQRAEPGGRGEAEYQLAPHDGLGRWPANVTLDETAAAMLDEQTGERPSSGGAAFDRQGYGGGWATPNNDRHEIGYGDTGGASRFFKVVAPDGSVAEGLKATGEAVGEGGASVLPSGSSNLPAAATRFRYVPKADREERNRGLGHMAPLTLTDEGYGSIQTPILDRATPRENWQPHKVANHHPTVKPVELMRWLCRMVTPKGGTVLDPFTGSGSTGVAAMREGFEFIGIEQSEEYVEIARARIIGDAPLFNQEVTA